MAPTHPRKRKTPMTNSLHSVQWSIQNGGYYACGPTLATVPAGAYLCQGDCQGNPYLQPKRLELDDLIDFSGSLSSRILHEIDRFWPLGDRFGQYGFLHRRGYLFYGKQGGGAKSRTARSGRPGSRSGR